MSEITYREAIERLVDWASVNASRDQRIWDAHQAKVSKAEISRITGLSWATVDRAVRDMSIKVLGTDDEEAGQ